MIHRIGMPKRHFDRICEVSNGFLSFINHIPQANPVNLVNPVEKDTLPIP